MLSGFFTVDTTSYWYHSYGNQCQWNAHVLISIMVQVTSLCVLWFISYVQLFFLPLCRPSYRVYHKASIKKLYRENYIMHKNWTYIVKVVFMRMCVFE